MTIMLQPQCSRRRRRVRASLARTGRAWALSWALAVVPGGFIPPVLAAAPSQATPARPNILWITVEDMSPNLGCYGDSYARTPHLDALAREAVRYTRAFATAPVCSPVRSCLITGVYATSLGTQRLRSDFPLPDTFHGFPSLLRAAGYYTSNDVKTDYNTADEPRLIRESWDACRPGARWKARRPGQPFFSVINLMTTHQSRTSVWPYEQFEREIAAKLTPEQRHDPKRAPLPPFYPNTPLARRAWARYHDCITRMDQQIGEILADLAADGLADDTIVFFYSDHGMGMPRGKRVLHDSGLHVPLLIRFPEKWRAFAPAALGTTVDRLVSFVDFPPTVLSLAGVQIPDHLQGTPFLGPRNGPTRLHVFGARDRVDEVYDVARSVRDKRWLYICNFRSDLSWMPKERYSDQSDFRQEFLRLAVEGRLGPGPMTYAAPHRAVEELYDTVADPHQLHNLADQPEHAARLNRLRAELRRWMRETRDLGLLPETEAWRVSAGTTPYEWASAQAQSPSSPLLKAAFRVGRPLKEDVWRAGLGAEDAAVRYWTVLALGATRHFGETKRKALVARLDDASPAVRIAAAETLARRDQAGSVTRALPVLEKALRSDNVPAALLAARALENLGATARPLVPAMQEVRRQAAAHEQQGGSPCWMFIRFALEEALEQLGIPAK